MTYRYPIFDRADLEEYSLSAAIIHALNGTVAPSTRVMPQPADKETALAQVVQPEPAPALEPRGPHKRRLGGKGIA